MSTDFLVPVKEPQFINFGTTDSSRAGSLGRLCFRQEERSKGALEVSGFEPQFVDVERFSCLEVSLTPLRHPPRTTTVWSSVF